MPTPAAIANGMVFVLAEGDNAVQFGPSGTLLNTQARKEKAGHAILYALDAVTGKVPFFEWRHDSQFLAFQGADGGVRPRVSWDSR